MCSVHCLMVKNKCNLQRKLHQSSCLPLPQPPLCAFPYISVDLFPCVQSILPLILTSLLCTPSGWTGPWTLMLGLATQPPTALSQGSVNVAVALMSIQGADRRAYSPMSHSLQDAKAPSYKCISLCPTQSAPPLS